MPKEVEPLQEEELIDIQSNNKDYTLSDGDGLHLLVKSSGSKIWQYRFTFEKKRILTNLGKYPKTTLYEARIAKDKIKFLSERGINPIANKKVVREQKKEVIKHQIHRIIDEYLVLQEGKIASNTHRQKTSYLNRYVIKPFAKKDASGKIISSRDINTITHGELYDYVLKPIFHYAETTHKIYTELSNIWLYAISRNYCSHNVLSNIDVKNGLPRINVTNIPAIVDEAVFGELLRAIDDYRGGVSVRQSLKLVAHLPLRAENLATLRWEMIDFENKILTIPRNEMKIKHKKLGDFKLPLSNQVVEILKFTQTYNGFSKWVFLNKSEKNHITQKAVINALVAMGFNDEKRDRKQTTHSFRTSYRTITEMQQPEHNATFEVKERVLDHFENNQVVRAYQRTNDYTEQIRPLLQWWSNHIDKLKTI